MQNMKQRIELAKYSREADEDMKDDRTFVAGLFLLVLCVVGAFMVAAFI